MIAEQDVHSNSRVEFQGLGTRYLLRAGDTDGRFALLEHDLPPRTLGAPLHTHTHESIAYVVKGKVKSTVGSEEFIMGPGDACRHPRGVLHGLEAIEDSVVVEIKSPAPEIGAFFAMRG